MKQWRKPEEILKLSSLPPSSIGSYDNKKNNKKILNLKLLNEVFYYKIIKEINEKEERNKEIKKLKYHEKEEEKKRKKEKEFLNYEIKNQINKNLQVNKEIEEERIEKEGIIKQREELSQKNLEINEKYEILTLQLKKQINTKKFLIKNLQKELKEIKQRNRKISLQKNRLVNEKIHFQNVYQKGLFIHFLQIFFLSFSSLYKKILFKNFQHWKFLAISRIILQKEYEITRQKVLEIERITENKLQLTEKINKRLENQFLSLLSSHFNQKKYYFQSWKNQLINQLLNKNIEINKNYQIINENYLNLNIKQNENENEIQNLIQKINYFKGLLRISEIFHQKLIKNQQINKIKNYFIAWKQILLIKIKNYEIVNEKNITIEKNFINLIKNYKELKQKNETNEREMTKYLSMVIDLNRRNRSNKLLRRLFSSWLHYSLQQKMKRLKDWPELWRLSKLCPDESLRSTYQPTDVIRESANRYNTNFTSISPTQQQSQQQQPFQPQQQPSQFQQQQPFQPILFQPQQQHSEFQPTQFRQFQQPTQFQPTAFQQQQQYSEFQPTQFQQQLSKVTSTATTSTQTDPPLVYSNISPSRSQQFLQQHQQQQNLTYPPSFTRFGSQSPPKKIPGAIYAKGYDFELPIPSQDPVININTSSSLFSNPNISLKNTGTTTPSSSSFDLSSINNNNSYPNNNNNNNNLSSKNNQAIKPQRVPLTIRTTSLNSNPDHDNYSHPLSRAEYPPALPFHQKAYIPGKNSDLNEILGVFPGFRSNTRPNRLNDNGNNKEVNEFDELKNTIDNDNDDNDELDSNLPFDSQSSLTSGFNSSLGGSGTLGGSNSIRGHMSSTGDYSSANRMFRKPSNSTLPTMSELVVGTKIENSEYGDGIQSNHNNNSSGSRNNGGITSDHDEVNENEDEERKMKYNSDVNDEDEEDTFGTTITTAFNSPTKTLSQQSQTGDYTSANKLFSHNTMSSSIIDDRLSNQIKNNNNNNNNNQNKNKSKNNNLLPKSSKLSPRRYMNSTTSSRNNSLFSSSGKRSFDSKKFDTLKNSENFADFTLTFDRTNNTERNSTGVYTSAAAMFDYKKNEVDSEEC